VTITPTTRSSPPGDVGGLFEIECEDFGDIKSWEPAVKGMTVGQKLKWAGNVYQIEALSDADGYTGSAPPEHDSGSEWDGSSGMDGAGNGPFGVKLKHLYGRFGLVRITGYTDATSVTATVIKRFPTASARSSPGVGRSARFPTRADGPTRSADGTTASSSPRATAATPA
jgi:hypothetical protein